MHGQSEMGIRRISVMVDLVQLVVGLSRCRKDEFLHSFGLLPTALDFQVTVCSLYNRIDETNKYIPCTL